MRIPNWLIRQVVTVKPLIGHSAYGPIYGPELKLRCRVESKRRLVRDKDGNEVVSEATLYCGPDTNITVGSEVHIDGTKYVVLQVKPHYLPNGKVHHVEVVLQ